jgi:hypothetical protein
VKFFVGIQSFRDGVTSGGWHDSSPPDSGTGSPGEERKN